MLTQIDPRIERDGTLRGQLKTPPQGAGHSKRGLTTTASKERVMAMPHLSNSFPCSPHRRGSSPRCGGVR